MGAAGTRARWEESVENWSIELDSLTLAWKQWGSNSRGWDTEKANLYICKMVNKGEVRARQDQGD